MSETERKILKNIAAALKDMPESQKEYLLGIGVGMCLMKELSQRKGIERQEKPADFFAGLFCHSLRSGR